MVTKEEVDNAFEVYERMITRAQHVYNRLYTELWKPYHVGPCGDCELFQAEMNGYDVKVRRGDKEDEIDFGTSDSDRYGDYIGYSTFKKEFLYNDEALTAYIESEKAKAEEKLQRERERAANARKKAAEKKEAEERATYERLKAKFENQ